MIYGIDVSNWQGKLNWDNRSIRFAFAKATEGTTYTDDQFARNWSQMASHKLIRGAYHFGHPGNDAVIEAEHFLAVVRGQGLNDGDLLALDLETDDGRKPADVAAWAKTWCLHVQQRTGRTPLVYTFVSFTRGGYCAGLGAYPLWIAAPSFPAGKPPMPLGPWKSWAVHQYADTPVDKDVSALSVAQLRALGSTTPEEDDVSSYLSVGQTKAQKLPDSTWTTIEFDTEHEDSDHDHWDKGGASVVTGPARYRLNCYSKITGLPVGAPAQIRLTRVATDDDSDRQSGPILEFTGSTGDTYVTYVIASDYIGAGRKTRIEIVQWSGQECVLEWSQLKAEITPQ